MASKPVKPPRRPSKITTSPEGTIGANKQDFTQGAADISAVQNRTELVDLDDVSNFDRTALSESGYDEDSRSELHQSKNSSFAGDERQGGGGGEWKVAGKSAASPPSKPARQIKSPEYVSSDNTNTSESIISAYQDRMDNTAADASVSKYNDYLGEEDSAIVLQNTTTNAAGDGAGVTAASPATKKGLFTNIYEAKGSPMGSPEAAPSTYTATVGSGGGSETLELKSRIRVLEAEARVRAKERMEFDQEMQKMEVNWSTELTAVSIRNKSLEDENKALREHQRKANIEMSRLIAQLASLEAAKENAELRVGNSKGKADREAMGTVLAQQKLLRLLEEQSASADAKAGLLQEESEALKTLHKEAAAQLVEWKARALAAEKALEVMGGEGDNEDDEGAEEGGKKKVERGEPMPLLSVENAARSVLNGEMEKYLSLERSTAIPVLARADNNAHAWQFQPRESTFTDYFRAADTNEELFSKTRVTPSVQSTSTTNRLQRYGKV